MIIINNSYPFDSIGLAEVSNLTRNQTQVDSINGFLVTTQSRYVRWKMSYQLVCDRQNKELLEQLYAELLGAFDFTDHRGFSWLIEAGTDDNLHAYRTGAYFLQGLDINGTPQQGNGFYACNQTWLIPTTFIVSARGLSGNTANVIVPGGGTDMQSEIPGGVVDGVNNTFTLTQSPVTLLLFINGVLQQQGVDYTFSGSTITILSGAIPQTGDSIVAYFTV